MESFSAFLLSALGYILKGAAQSKAAETAKEETLNRFWRWLRPRFIGDLPEIEKAPDSPQVEEKAHEKLLELIKEEAFFKELSKQVVSLRQDGVQEKNIVKKDIKRVKKIRIGDKEYSPDETWQRKNIVEGNIEDAEEFILGDGH